MISLNRNICELYLFTYLNDLYFKIENLFLFNKYRLKRRECKVSNCLKLTENIGIGTFPLKNHAHS